ncbi:MAG TPA: MotA/TolQ/ExbB proton channel family protein [Candidatus Eisenbacteria bacterium]|nr:MotA/TolQ/ExbB proton channel family protein [Candidatus Eisenbacteria bacterium]
MIATLIAQVGGGLGASVPALVTRSGPFAKGVLFVLLAISVYSWAVIVNRLRLYGRVAREDRAFLNAFRVVPADAELRLVFDQHPESLLARVARTGQRSLEQHPEAPNTPNTMRYEMAQRAMDRAANEETARLERHVGFLATAGSVSPFLGLMGTVWGVMSAFMNIGVQGSASLVVVAPGIAEALIATVAGLAAAIPAVVAYNSFTNRVREFANGTSAFASEYLDRRIGGRRA